MTQFSVFFDGPLGLGIFMVEARRASDAAEIVLKQYPAARLSVKAEDEIKDQSGSMLLAQWLDQAR